MTASPQVSVVVCSYNRAHSLGAALESVIRQETHGEFRFEVLVVDDGSTDGTNELVQRFTDSSTQLVRYFRENGKGVPFARNRGVAEASGEWIAFFDDDQIAEPGWLHGLVRTAKETGAEIVGGARFLRFSDGREHRVGPVTRGVLGEKDHGPRTRRCNRHSLACTGNILLKRDLFARIGLFDTEMHTGMSDIDLTRRALDAGVPSWYTPGAVVWHVVPAHRLQEDYLRWTCLRVGMNLSIINNKSRGAFGMLWPCLLRSVHAVALNPILDAIARVTRNAPRALDRKCFRWMAEGSVRMALHVLWPGLFPQSALLQRLAFRGERLTFAGGG